MQPFWKSVQEFVSRPVTPDTMRAFVSAVRESADSPVTVARSGSSYSLLKFSFAGANFDITEKELQQPHQGKLYAAHNFGCHIMERLR